MLKVADIVQERGRCVSKKWALAVQLGGAGKRQGRQEPRKAKKTWEETGHQKSNRKLHSNEECSCTSAPKRSLIDAFVKK
jgi:hypothetical protein